MGTEVSQDHFSEDDFSKFKQQLDLETDCLIQMLSANQFSNHPPVAGFEIEACLIDSKAQPASVNQQFLNQVSHSMFTPELAKFNIELNTIPQPLKGNAFKHFESGIRDLIGNAHRTAHDLDAEVMFTGILPTLTVGHFRLEYMSDMKRYHALNKQILKARQGAPIRFDIEGHQALHMKHNSVMLESATTSLQLHLQTPIKQAHHYYNASILASAAVTAVSGNSPYLFGNELWHETRIPVFEQAIDLGKGPQRVTFGSGYIDDIKECFIENRDHFPIILPMTQDEPVEKFVHLSLHNGVVWRWNRPLVGFDPDGTPHIRIEHRVMPAGPTVVDMIANAAFFYGLCQYFADYLEKGHQIPLPFKQAKNNFYTAARHGLQAKFDWECQQVSAKSLVLSDFLPFAKQGLEQLQIDESSIDYYLSIIQGRVETGQTGAVWQMEHVHQNTVNKPEMMQQLTLDYFQRQQSGDPVHTWSH